MNDNLEHEAAAPSMAPNEHRSSGNQRPSHVWSNTKRNMMDEIEFQQ